MSSIHGHAIPLSPARRLMCDMMHASRQVPLVSFERLIDLRAVREARSKCAEPPSWFAVFIKAFALVAMRRPALRTSYLTFPWPRLYQHAYNVATLPVERRIGNEDAVLFMQLWKPEEKSLADLHAEIRRAKEIPLDEEPMFRNALRLARFPRLIRRLCWWIGLCWNGYWRMVNFGTFGATGVAGQGASSLTFLSPFTCTFAVTAFQPDGKAFFRLMCDHRVMDGVEPARALADIEACLNGEILRELEAMPRASVGA
jgi:hypothetical protein